VLPALFAIPTGLMDLVLAGTSFFVAARMVAEGGRVLRGFVVWHQLGLASLGVSALTAVLTSTARYGETHAGITSQPMTQFPMSLVPIFIGPLVLICHLLALTTERGILESEQEMEKTRVS
jgi:hypothetical protein